MRGRFTGEKAKKSGGPLRGRRQSIDFRPGSEPDAAAEEDPPAQRVVGLRVRVAVAGRTGEAGERRILVEDVVDTQEQRGLLRHVPLRRQVEVVLLLELEVQHLRAG